LRFPGNPALSLSGGRRISGFFLIYIEKRSRRAEEWRGESDRIRKSDEPELGS